MGLVQTTQPTLQEDETLTESDLRALIAETRKNIEAEPSQNGDDWMLSSYQIRRAAPILAGECECLMEQLDIVCKGLITVFEDTEDEGTADMVSNVFARIAELKGEPGGERE